MTLQTAKAHWVSRDTIAWIGAEPNGTYRLYHSPTGQIIAQISDGALRGPFIPLYVDRDGLPQLVVEKFPFLKEATTLKVSEGDWARIPGLLKGELVLAKMNNAASADATTLLLAGVLNDLFYFDGELGAQRCGDEIRFRLWAPTARAVRLFVSDGPDEAAREVYPMAEGGAGVWEVLVGDLSWLNSKYYVYEVEVFSRQHAQIRILERQFYHPTKDDRRFFGEAVKICQRRPNQLGGVATVGVTGCEWERPGKWEKQVRYGQEKQKRS